MHKELPVPPPQHREASRASMTGAAVMPTAPQIGQVAPLSHPLTAMAKSDDLPTPTPDQLAVASDPLDFDEQPPDAEPTPVAPEIPTKQAPVPSPPPTQEPTAADYAIKSDYSGVNAGSDMADQSTAVAPTADAQTPKTAQDVTRPPQAAEANETNAQTAELHVASGLSGVAAANDKTTLSLPSKQGQTLPVKTQRQAKLSDLPLAPIIAAVIVFCVLAAITWLVFAQNVPFD